MNKRILYSGLLLLLTTVTFGQKKVKEGIIRYLITDVHTEVPEMELMENSTLALYFTDKQQKVEMNLMQGALVTQTIINDKTGETTVLTDLMGRRIKIDKPKEERREPMLTQDIIYDKDATREIAGYKCHKAIIKGKNGDRLIAYVTSRITPKADYFDNLFMGLEGFPLEYTVVNNQVAITFTANEIISKVDESAFYVLGEYETMTETEFQALMGGMELGF